MSFEPEEMFTLTIKYAFHSKIEREEFIKLLPESDIPRTYSRNQHWTGCILCKRPKGVTQLGTGLFGTDPSVCSAAHSARCKYYQTIGGYK